MLMLAMKRPIRRVCSKILGWVCVSALLERRQRGCRCVAFIRCCNLFYVRETAHIVKF